MSSDIDQNHRSSQEVEPARDAVTVDAPKATADNVSDPVNPMDAQLSGLLAMLRPPQAEDELGRLAGFRITKLLGRGGMGAVFEAHDLLVRRKVALKVMRPDLTVRPESRERFLREARTAATVEHDHIIPVYQVGEDNGVLFIAMPLLKGESLERRLERERPLPMAIVLKIGRDVAEGLTAAHARELIHRDIKPGNLWLEEADDSGAEFRRVKILDFGLARAVHEDTHLTSAGGILGTPAYMAPEQAEGQEVDRRADLFSLGAVLYRCCTGRLPFSGPNTMAILSALANKMPIPVRERNPEVPAGLADLIVRLLAKVPEERPQSATEVAESLRRIEQEYALPSPKKVSKRPRSRWKAACIAALLGLAMMVAAAVIAVKVRGPDGKETEITVPERSKINVDPKGNIVVTLPPDKPATPTVEPAASAPAKQADLLELECRLKAGDSVVNSLAITPDGARVAAGYYDGYLRVWDLSERKIIRTYNTGSKLRALALHPDGKTLAVNCEDGRLFLWDVMTGEVVRQFTGHSVRGRFLSFARRGETLVTSDDETKSILCWETATGKHKVLTHYAKESHSGFVQVAPDGEHVGLVTEGERGTVQLLEISSGKSTWTARWPTGAAAPVFTSDGKKLASAHWNDVRIWDLKSGTPESIFGWGEGQIWGLAISPENRSLAAANTGARQVQLFDLAGPPHPARIWTGAAPNRVAFTPDGRRLLSVHSDGTICVFKVPEKVPVWRGFPPLDDAWLARTSKLPADAQVKEVTAELVQRNPGFKDSLSVLKDGEGRVWSASVRTAQLEDLSPFRGFPALRELKVDANGMAVNSAGKVWDLSCLRGMRLTYLEFSGCNRIRDLSPLRDMPLTVLVLETNPLCDLTPLQDMKLQGISLVNTNVDDISPLKGMPLRGASLLGTRIKDFSPLSKSPINFISVSAPDLESLRDLPLETVRLFGDYKPEQIEMTLAIPTLKRLEIFGKYDPEQLKEFRGNPILTIINGKPAAEFWKTVDKAIPDKKGKAPAND